MPQDAVAEQRTDDFGRCSLYMSWTPPSNIAKEKVTEFLIYVNGTNTLNETNDISKNLTLAVYPVCSCAAYHISIRAVNRCGRIGQSTSIFTLDQKPRAIPQRECVRSITEPPYYYYITRANNPNESEHFNYVIQLRYLDIV